LSIWPENLEQAGLNTKRIILYYSAVPSEILSNNYNKKHFHSYCYSTVAFLSSFYMGRRKFLSTEQNILEDDAALTFGIEIAT